MRGETCFLFVNAWHVTLSLPLSDGIFLHAECCVENKFSSSHPPGPLCFGVEGGETIHGHYCAECVQCRYDSLSSFFFLKSFTYRLVFVSDLAVSQFIGGRRFVEEVTGRAGAVRDEIVRASVLCRLCHPTC